MTFVSISTPVKNRGFFRYGALCYIVGVVQFFAAMGAAAFYYGPPGYNFQKNSISDLQAVHCATFGGKYVCSPLHVIANLSVTMVGLLLILGTLLIRDRFSSGRRQMFAFGLLIVAGAGAAANGFTPEDVTLNGDILSAVLAFLAANFGLIQLGRAMSDDVYWHNLRAYTKISGAVGLGALILDGVNITGPLGSGIEWLIVAPISLWMFVVGIQLLRIPLGKKGLIKQL